METEPEDDPPAGETASVDGEAPAVTTSPREGIEDHRDDAPADPD